MSLVNSHSPKTNQTFSFSDSEYPGSAENSEEDDADNHIKVKSKNEINSCLVVSTDLLKAFF